MRSEGGMLAGSALSQLQSWDACALRSLDSCAFQSRSILSSVTPPPSPGPVTRVTDCGTVVCVSAWPLSAAAQPASFSSQSPPPRLVRCLLPPAPALSIARHAGTPPLALCPSVQPSGACLLTPSACPSFVHMPSASQRLTGSPERPLSSGPSRNLVLPRPRPASVPQSIYDLPLHTLVHRLPSNSSPPPRHRFPPLPRFPGFRVCVY